MHDLKLTASSFGGGWLIPLPTRSDQEEVWQAFEAEASKQSAF